MGRVSDGSVFFHVYILWYMRSLRNSRYCHIIDASDYPQKLIIWFSYLELRGLLQVKRL